MAWSERASPSLKHETLEDLPCISIGHLVAVQTFWPSVNPPHSEKAIGPSHAATLQYAMEIGLWEGLLPARRHLTTLPSCSSRTATLAASA